MNREPIAKSVYCERDEYLRMQLALELFKPSKLVTDTILQAYNSREWDWRTSDGCTAVSELYFPEGFRFPPCVAHDFYCEHKCSNALSWKHRNEIREEGDRRFYLAMRDFGVSRFRARLRWLGVRAYWNLVGQWRSLSARVRSGRNCCRGL